MIDFMSFPTKVRMCGESHAGKLIGTMDGETSAGKTAYHPDLVHRDHPDCKDGHACNAYEIASSTMVTLARELVFPFVLSLLPYIVPVRRRCASEQPAFLLFFSKLQDKTLPKECATAARKTTSPAPGYN